MDEIKQVGETVSAWEDLGPTQRSPSSGTHSLPSDKTLEIAGMLGLRFPPANSVDREAHAARVVLLAKDCADIDPRWFEAAADDWGKSKAFFPKAHEMRELAAQMQRMAQPRRPMLAAPPPRPKPVPPPLTDAEIATMPGWIVKMGIGMGEIDPARAAQLRGDQAIDSQGISNV